MNNFLIIANKRMQRIIVHIGSETAEAINNHRKQNILSQRIQNITIVFNKLVTLVNVAIATNTPSFLK